MDTSHLARWKPWLFHQHATRKRKGKWNVETPGGPILLATRDDVVVQEHPLEPERMPASFAKQRVFNKRVWEAEDQVGPKNAGVAEFLTGTDIAETTAVVLAIRARNKGAELVFGQRWVNGILTMIATSRLLDRMDLSVERDASMTVLTWRHVFQQTIFNIESPRTVIYPAEPAGLRPVLGSLNGGTNMDMLSRNMKCELRRT
jgi:hypothetical protein